MTDAQPAEAKPPMISASTKQILTSVTTSLIVAALGGLVHAQIISASDASNFAAEAAPIVLTIVGGLAMIAWKAYISKSTKIALAEELPDVSRVVTTDAIANSPKFVNNSTVVSYKQALESPPPPPAAQKVG